MRCALLHAPGEVDGHAHHVVVCFDAAAQQHLAGVDPNPDRETGQAIVALNLLGVKPGIRKQRKAGTDGAFGVVFAADVGAERRRQPVSHEAQHASAVGLYDGCEAGQRAVHDGVGILRVECLAMRVESTTSANSTVMYLSR